MTEIEFDELWQELIHVEYKDGGYENIRQVQSYLHRLPGQKRAAFLDELVSVGLNKKDGWGIALRVLETDAMPQQIRTICQAVKSLPDDDSEAESNLVWALRVLASDPNGLCLAPIEEYLLKRRIGSNWNSLPWALWPHHPDLFCRAWVRYFTSRPSKEWRRTVIPQAFLTNADALVQLRSKLSRASEGAWQELRNVLWEQRNAPWLTEEQRKSLAEVIVS
jgi:hypothetical protein